LLLRLAVLTCLLWLAVLRGRWSTGRSVLT
jgi:hypothetical protein